MFRDKIQRRLQQTRTPRSVWTDPIHFITCGFGIGALPLIPGTFGTLVGVVFYLLIAPLNLWLYISIVTIAVLAGIWLCGVTNKGFGTDDHPAAVWDEIATFPIVMIAVPLTWYTLLGGFLLFRLFDIWKPGPIGWLDKNLHGGTGVMLDDVAAAIAAWAVLQALLLALN